MIPLSHNRLTQAFFRITDYHYDINLTSHYLQADTIWSEFLWYAVFSSAIHVVCWCISQQCIHSTCVVGRARLKVPMIHLWRPSKMTGSFLLLIYFTIYYGMQVVPRPHKTNHSIYFSYTTSLFWNTILKLSYASCHQHITSFLKMKSTFSIHDDLYLFSIKLIQILTLMFKRMIISWFFSIIWWNSKFSWGTTFSQKM